MIIINVHLLDPERRIFLECGIEGLFEFSQNIVFQDLSAVLGTPQYGTDADTWSG